MTNDEIIKNLKQIKTYCATNLLESLEYAIKVMQKLDLEGIENPLEADFSKLKEGEEK